MDFCLSIDVEKKLHVEVDFCLSIDVEKKLHVEVDHMQQHSIVIYVLYAHTHVHSVKRPKWLALYFTLYSLFRYSVRE